MTDRATEGLMGKILQRAAAVHRAQGRESERGSLIIEAIIVMMIVSVTLASFTTGMIVSIKAQRDSQNTDIATQYANGVIEQARSLSWDRVVISTVDPNRRPEPGTWRSRPTAYGNSTHFPALQTKRMRNVDFTFRTDITWQNGPIGSSTYGEKRIEVTVTFKDMQNNTKSYSYVAHRTPTPGEIPAAPTTTSPGEVTEDVDLT